MAFQGSVIGSWEIDPDRKVYQGGVRTPTVTARAVLSLVQSNTLYTDKLDITYLINSRIIYITGGNHRMLAYKLLGIVEFPLFNLPNHYIKLYEDNPHEQLNQALLFLENRENHYDPRETNLIVRGNEQALIEQAAKYGAYN